MSDEKKNVGESINVSNADWNFGGDVSLNFSKHVRRSIPLYDLGHDLICNLSDYFLKDNSICYELGVSTGQLIKKLSTHNINKKISLIGIDIEEKMIQQAQDEIGHSLNIKLILDDINSYDYEPCDLIISYYTMQFIPPKLRQNLFNTIFESLNWGGAFILFEKVRGNDARFQDIMTGVYIDYKLNQDYKPDEIIAKCRSLKGKLEPFSTQGNIDFLKRAGFVDIISIMKYVCFEGFLAIK